MGSCTFRKGSVVTRPPYATSSPMYSGIAGRVRHGASPLQAPPGFALALMLWTIFMHRQLFTLRVIFPKPKRLLPYA